MADRVSELAKTLRTYWLRDLERSISTVRAVTIQQVVTQPGGGDALELDWLVPQSRLIIAGEGLSGGGDLSADITLSLVSSVAGAGLTYASGVLAVGAGAGVTINANDVALTTPGTLTYNSTNSASGSHTHAITSNSNPGAAASILQSTSGGLLTLVGLTATTSLTTPLIAGSTINISPSVSLILDPATVILDPTGNNVQPLTNYDINLGTINKKYLTLHAAELWVETLVAQNTIATIGGRILVGPTTVLTVDLAPADTSITVKHNEMASGDRVYMEADGKVEFFAITSAAGGSAGAYTYSVTRNLDGTGANQWYAGDAMFNTGVTGEGFIDLYSLRGVKAATEYGPTIVGNIRLSDTYNDWAPRWAVGNLNGLYDYATTRYGFAAGNPATTWIAADASNGFRVMKGSVTRFQVNSTGNLRINNASGTNVIALDDDGTSYFAGSMTLGTSGGIYQGSGTFASPTTGLKLWNDTGIGRIGGYNTGTLQWSADTDGRLMGGAGNAYLDATGFNIITGTSNVTQETSLNFVDSVGGSVDGYVTMYNQMTSSYFELGFPAYTRLVMSTGPTGDLLNVYAPDGTSFDGPVSAPYGTVSLPSFAFNGDDNTGMYNVTDNTIGWAVAGGLGMQLSTTSLMLGSTADSIFRMRTPGSNTVADNGTLTIGAAFTGILFLLCPSDSSVAIYGCDGGATYEISDPEGFWTVAKDTAAKHNVYVESGNLIVQNKRTASRVYHIMCFGTSSAYA